MKRKLLDNGNIWQKSDGRWIGMVRYKDEYGVTQRKSFSSKKKKTLQAKMTEYVKNFNEQVANSDESRKPLKESMKNWLRVYKYPEVERTTYDRYECTAEHQIYPYIGNKRVGDVTPADIKKLLTKHMYNGYAFTTSKKAYSLLKPCFAVFRPVCDLLKADEESTRQNSSRGVGRLSRIVSDRPDIITPPAVKTTGGVVNPLNSPLTMLCLCSGGF